MLFNSISFLIFLPTIYFLYWFVFQKNIRSQNLTLIIASYFFYGWWSWKFLFLLIFSSLLDYFYGFAVAYKKKSKLFLILSIINNIGVLFIFKYYDFFAREIKDSLEYFGISTHPQILNIALPIGISFYTFHGMSYVFDIYSGKQKPVKNFIDYGLFVSFFPLLVAGPIERANHLLPQIQTKRKFNYTQSINGLRLIVWGLFKKVVIADSLAKIADQIFANYQDYNSTSLLVGAISFSFQIYCDFSGYSDIGIGTSKLLGFELLSNFKFPYFSRNLIEFWKKWHISLTSWFRDYVYIPLGGSKKNIPITIRNIFIIFLLSGFWHGANWTYLVWGFLHVIGYIFVYYPNKGIKPNFSFENEVRFPTFIELSKMLVTFSFVTLTWVYFRSENISSANEYIYLLFADIIIQPNELLKIPYGINAFIYIFPFVLAEWYIKRDERNFYFKNKTLETLLTWIVIILIISKFNNQSNFIYFQF